MYSSQIARIICRDAVEYSVEKYHNKIASKCKLFTSEQEGRVTIEFICRDTGIGMTKIRKIRTSWM